MSYSFVVYCLCMCSIWINTTYLLYLGAVIEIHIWQIEFHWISWVWITADVHVRGVGGSMKSPSYFSFQRISKSWPRISKSWPRISKSWPRISKSWPRISKSWPRISKSWPRISKSWPRISKSWPRISNSWPRISNSWPRFKINFYMALRRHRIISEFGFLAFIFFFVYNFTYYNYYWAFLHSFKF